MLGGLSPNIISLANTLLASLLAGALGILAASITQLDPSTLPLQIIPALAAALIASFTSFGIAASAASASPSLTRCSSTPRPSPGSRSPAASRCPASPTCSRS